MKQYKAVSGPMTINVSKGNTQSAFNLFADIINHEAQGGWAYHSMETITVQEKTGCFLNKQVTNTNIYMLIFCREQ